MQQYDVAVIGGGPGGYVSAIRAAQNGLKTVLIEKDTKLGGTCLLRGCIPTKSLLHAADLYEKIKGAAAFGIAVNNVSYDFGAIQKTRAQVVNKSASGVDYLMRTHHIAVQHGTAQLKDQNTLNITDHNGQHHQLTYRNLIIATGSAPRKLKDLPDNSTYIVTSDEILTLAQPPQSLLVLGAGAVGVEFASIYARLGCKTTVVEAAPLVLPTEDHDIGLAFAKHYRSQNIAVLTDTKLIKATIKQQAVHATLLQNGKEQLLTADMLLVAIGRLPCSAGLGLLQAGVQVDDGGYITINEFMQTNVPHIYAIGDVVRTPWLAHVASAEGILVADHLAGKKPHPLNYLTVPSCIYAHPEVASVGLSEQKAKERGYTLKIGQFPFSAIAKARIQGDTFGFVKIIAEAQYGEILGVHIIGPHATELIGEACAVVKGEYTIEEWANTIHAHPTLGESMLEAAHATIGHAIHI